MSTKPAAIPFFLVNFLIGVVFNLLGRGASIFGILGLIYSLALLVPNLAAGVRRLHDTGKPGWFLLLWLIPIVGWVVIIVFLAKAGNPGPNQYGNPDV